MGLKATIANFLERVYPARVAPFVQMVATAIKESPGAFTAEYQEEANILRVRLAPAIDATEPGSDESVLVTNGVGLDVDFFDNSMSIVTYYFDSIALNWRERRLLLGVLHEMFDAHEDARRLASFYAGA